MQNDVTQVDRDAAANAVKAYRDQKNGNWQERIRKGECDAGEMVQAFAAHRIAAEAETAKLSLATIDRQAAEIAALQARVAELEGDLFYIGSKWPIGLYTDHFKYDNGVTRLIVWLNEKEVEEIKRIASKEPTQ